MVEIKLTVDEIDYGGIAKLVMPIVKEKLSEKGEGLGGLIGRHVPESALQGALKGFLAFLSPEQKDDVAIRLITKYEDEIVEILQNTARSKGVELRVNGISVSRTEDPDG